MDAHDYAGYKTHSDRLHLSTGGSSAAGKEVYQNDLQVTLHIQF